MALPFQDQSADAARVISLALTPVFLLSAVGLFLNVLVGRVARLADRARKIETEGRPGDRADLAQLIGLADRTRTLYSAIVAVLLSAVLAVLIVILLFANALFETDLSGVVEGLFIAASLALLFGLLLFFAEVSLAAAQLRERRRELAAAQASAPPEEG